MSWGVGGGGPREQPCYLKSRDTLDSCSSRVSHVDVQLMSRSEQSSVALYRIYNESVDRMVGKFLEFNSIPNGARIKQVFQATMAVFIYGCSPGLSVHEWSLCVSHISTVQ